jgi:hypothetical protein
MDTLKPLISKIIYNFAKKNNVTARATPGGQVILIIFPVILVILEIKSFKVASCQVVTLEITPGRCDLDF